MPAHASYVPCASARQNVCRTTVLLCKARLGTFWACQICQSPTPSIEYPPPEPGRNARNLTFELNLNLRERDREREKEGHVVCPAQRTQAEYKRQVLARPSGPPADTAAPHGCGKLAGGSSVGWPFPGLCSQALRVQIITCIKDGHSR
ncbi:hypothetical protein SKAU_G00270050 [Synaphobranchus kaupii]|uniref:Uncharacterized protein n=1 Tax=Synaphobranchus kaupii TaxID=118154 RepID=A0A9Q1F0F4_SYNKA|nr:hypothetical protein SKAU_G00270050 [Synaphobranchus kaupii]